jgi:L-asparaginase
MLNIHFFCVGGTIDKIYFDANSQYEVGSPAVKTLLASLPTNVDATITSVMAKDSLEMTDGDRADLLKAIAAAPQKLIVVTHGTDTMPLTAEYLQANSAKNIGEKVIVLTGALAPAIFKQSDAEFNLGTAIAAAQCLPTGVYVAMNGEIFEAGKVVKDTIKSRFVAKQ